MLTIANLLNTRRYETGMETIFLASVASKLINKLVELINAKPAELTVAFIPTAADLYADKWFIDEERQRLINLGFRVVDVTLGEKQCKVFSEKLKQANIIFVAGGNSFYLLQKAKESGFGAIIKSLVQEGRVYVGSSAGAIIAGPTIEPFKTIDDPSQAPHLASYEGLCLVDFVVLPHFGEKKYKEKYDAIMRQMRNAKQDFYTLTDNQAILVKDGKMTLVTF